MSQTGVGQQREVNIIVLANQPRMFRQMLQRVLDQSPRLCHALELDNGEDLDAILGRVRARWLVITLAQDGTLPDAARDALAEHRDLAVLAVSADGDHIEVHVSPHAVKRRRYSLDDITLNDLLRILRTEG